jgi:hypothetical protein
MTTVDLSRANVQAPPTPNKWDIIPIHTSDRGTFKFCRRQWAWSSPSKRNLIPKAMVHGIRDYFWFGTGIHYALEHYYHPGLKEDPEVTFATWFDLQWNGGLITEDELPNFVDRHPVLTGNHKVEIDLADMKAIEASIPIYKVQGLLDILPNPDVDLFMNYRDLGIGMMKFYKTYAEINDNFVVIATEHDFSVPILDPSTDGVMYALDTRTPPGNWEPDYTVENIYGPLMRGHHTGILKQVHARGRQDLLIQDQQSGRFGIQDYKTTSRLDDDYFRHLELDEQCTTYLWAAEREATMHDLEYRECDYITYQAMLKAYPKPPTITTRGIPSISRADESCTAKMFEDTINSNPAWKEMFARDEKWQNYYTWLLEIGDKRFIDRKDVWRNRTQRKNAGLRLYYEAMDMLNSPALYPNPTKTYGCLNCIFRAPCIAAEDGSDYESMLQDGYEPNWDR